MVIRKPVPTGVKSTEGRATFDDQPYTVVQPSSVETGSLPRSPNPAEYQPDMRGSWSDEIVEKQQAYDDLPSPLKAGREGQKIQKIKENEALPFSLRVGAPGEKGGSKGRVQAELPAAVVEQKQPLGLSQGCHTTNPFLRTQSTGTSMRQHINGEEESSVDVWRDMEKPLPPPPESRLASQPHEQEWGGLMSRLVCRYVVVIVS